MSDDFMPDAMASSLVTLVSNSKIEMCGLIFDDWSFAEVPNIASHPEHSFFMDPQRQLDIIQKHAESVIGVYHSHVRPNEEPSPDDLLGWHPKLPWRYFIIASGKVREFVRDSDRKPALVWTGPTTNLVGSQP